MGDEDFINPGDGAALGGAGVELSIGERARATLAETIVRLLDHAAFPKDRREVETARAGVLAALQDDGFQPEFQAAQRGEHAGRTAADDDDGPGSRAQRSRGPMRPGLVRGRAVKGDVEPELHFDRPLPGVDRMLAKDQPADP